VKRVVTVCAPAIIVLSVIVFMVGCQPQPTPTPEQVPEPQIPANFTTYTEEGFFSISYPSDWQPATLEMEEIWEETKAKMKAEDPAVTLEQTAMLFFAGKKTSEGYYPFLNILTDVRSFGYWTLDEISEANRQYERETTKGYKELSVIKTTVDGRDVIILDSEDNEPDYGRWRYIQMYTVKGDFVWLVTCGCEYQDFSDYEETFHSIARSFKILN